MANRQGKILKKPAKTLTAKPADIPANCSGRVLAGLSGFDPSRITQLVADGVLTPPIGKNNRKLFDTRAALQELFAFTRDQAGGLKNQKEKLGLRMDQLKVDKAERQDALESGVLCVTAEMEAIQMEENVRIAALIENLGAVFETRYHPTPEQIEGLEQILRETMDEIARPE